MLIPLKPKAGAANSHSTCGHNQGLKCNKFVSHLPTTHSVLTLMLLGIASIKLISDIAMVNANINIYMRRVLVDSFIGGHLTQQQEHGEVPRAQQTFSKKK